MKKFLAAVLAMAMALSLVSFASAEETYTIGAMEPERPPDWRCRRLRPGCAAWR